MGNYATHQRNQLGMGIGSPAPITNTNRVPGGSSEPPAPIRTTSPGTGRSPTGPISSLLTNRTPGATKTPPPGPSLSPITGFKDYRTAPGSQPGTVDYQKARGNPNVRNAAKLTVNEPTPTGPTPQQIAAQQQQQAQAAAEAQQAAQQAAAIAAQQAQFWVNHEAAKRMRGEL